MYTLEYIWINTKEHLFFEESTAYDRQANLEFNEYYFSKHFLLDRHSELNQFIVTPSRSQQDDGTWKKVIRISGFKSAIGVEAYYLDSVLSKWSKYPDLKRAWQQANKIIAEVNILDANGDVVKLLSSCQGNICVKFGTCDDAGDDGCHIRPSLPQLVGKFPIYHIQQQRQ